MVNPLPTESGHAFPQGIGDDEDVESTSSGTIQTEEGYQPVFFDPRPLKNLLPIDEMESLSAITDMKVLSTR